MWDLIESWVDRRGGRIYTPLWIISYGDTHTCASECGTTHPEPIHWYQCHRVLVRHLLLLCAHLHTDEKTYCIWCLLTSTYHLYDVVHSICTYNPREPTPCAWSVELLTYRREDTHHTQITSTYHLYDVVHNICAYNLWTYQYVCLDRGSTHTYLHTKWETHVMHKSLVPTTYMMWYITYVHTIHGHTHTCDWRVEVLIPTCILKSFMFFLFYM